MGLIGSPMKVVDKLETSALHTHAGAKFSRNGGKHNPPLINRWNQSIMALSFLSSVARELGLHGG